MRQRLNVLLDPTATVVCDVQHSWAGKTGQPLNRATQSSWLRRILANPFLNLPRKIRIALVKDFLGFSFTLRRFDTKRPASSVVDKNIAGEQVTPPQGGSRKTKFVFLTIAPAVALIETVRNTPSFARHEHTKPNRRGQLHGRTGIRRCHRLINGRNRHHFIGFGLCDTCGIAGNRRVIRERRDRGHFGAGLDMRHHTV